MKENKTIHEVELRANIESLMKETTKARELLNNLLTMDKPPKELVAAFAKLDKIFDSLNARKANFKGTDAEFKGITSDLHSVGKQLAAIERITGSIAGMDSETLAKKFLGKEDYKKFQQATKAVSEYKKALNTLETSGSRALTEAKNKQDNIKNKLENAKDKQANRIAVKKAASETEGGAAITAAKNNTTEKNKQVEIAKGELKNLKNEEAAARAQLRSLNAEQASLKSQISKEQESIYNDELEKAQSQLAAAEAALAEAEKRRDETVARYNNAGLDKRKKDPSGGSSYREDQQVVKIAKQARDQAQANIAAVQNSDTGKVLTGIKTLSKAIIEQKKVIADSAKEVENKTNNLTDLENELAEVKKEEQKVTEKYEEDAKILKEASDACEASEAEVKKLTQAHTEAESAVTRLSDATVEETNKQKDRVRAYDSLVQQANELGIKLEDLGITTDYTKDNANKLVKAIENLNKEQLEGIAVSSSVQQQLKTLSEMQRDNIIITEQQAETEKQYREQVAQTEAFENRMKQFLGLSGAAQVLRSALRDAMQTITELDATMTEMAVVTDLGVSDYWDQLPEYTNRANALGLAINDVYQADTLFYQQGLKTNEVVEISTETMKMARIAGLDTAEATNRMTAALRGFNMELNQTSAQKVADVYSELAAITAADTEEISSAMTKTASIASNAGMEFETTAAFLSQIIETTRESAETAGTAMKTIIARFQELKKDPAEIGEVDGEIVDANKIEGALRSVGVALRDSSGQFRDLDDVFLELAEKWDGLDKNTQRYIATIAAGSRQQSRFLAMMSDYSRTQELVTAANTSAGASNDQFGKTLDSLESKVAKLKNAWHEFTMGILESDLVKFGVDILTKFLEVVNKATSAFDGLGGSLTKIAGTLVVFKIGQKIFEKLKAPLVSFFAKIVAEARETGEKAGDAAAQGMEKSKQKTTNTSDEPSKEPQTLGGVIKEKSGWSDIQGGFKALKGGTQQAQEDYRKKKKEDLKAQKEAQRQAEAEAAQEDWDKKKYRKNEDPEKIKAVERRKKAQEELNKEIKVTKEELALTAEEQKQIAIQSKDDAWKQLGNGLTQMGKAALGAGTAVSMLGGILSSLGLEEVGEVVSTIGNGTMMLGTAMMAIPPIISAIQTILKKPPLGIILIILAAVLAAIIAIVAVINNNSPEKKLERAQEAADAAAEAASNAAEAYNKLAESLDNLGDKYDALEELTRGTKEWNEAVQEINNSVLDLIAEYPELASFVTKTDGVLRLDVEDPRVQSVLQGYSDNVTYTKNASVKANLEVAEAQENVDAENLAKETGLSSEKVKEVALGLASGDITSLSNFSYAVQKSSDALLAFGKELLNNEAAADTSYEAMAIAAENLADLTHLTLEEQEQAKNVTDGNTYAAFEQAVENDLSKLDMSGSDGSAFYSEMTGEQQQAFDQALKNVYGDENASYDTSTGEVTYTDADGNIQQEELSVRQDQVKNQMAAIIASERHAAATEAAPIAIEKLDAKVGTEAFSRMFQKDEGAAMTQEDLKAIAGEDGILDDSEIAEYWEALGPEGQKAFASSTEFAEKLRGIVDIADDAFEWTDTHFEKIQNETLKTNLSKLTSGAQKGLNSDERVGAVYASGTEEEIAAFEQNLAAALSGENAEDVAAFLNSFEWEGANAEAFTSAAHTLINEFGVAPDIANNLTESISNAVDATQSLTILDEAFGAFYQSTKKLAEALERAADLQWDYERMLTNGADALDLSANLEEQRNAYLAAGQKALEAANNARDLQAEKYAKGVNLEGVEGYDLTKYVTFDPNTNSYNTEALNQFMEDMNWGEDTGEYKAITAWVNELVEANDLSKEQIEQAKDAYVALEELNETAKEGYANLWEQISNALITPMEKAISTEEEILAATQEGNDKLIGKIQEQIDTDRQERQNKEARENIADLQAQAAYLGMDTSGANGLEILQLEEQIAQAEQDYQDSLIDQSIQSLQDANEKAYEQRERQISIAQAQLDMYRNSQEHQNNIQEVMNEYMDAYYGYEEEYKAWQLKSLGKEEYEKIYGELSEQEKTHLEELGERITSEPTFKPEDTALGQLMIRNGVLQGMSDMQKDDFWQQFALNTSKAAFYIKKLDNYSEGTEKGDQAKLLEDIQNNTALNNLVKVLWGDRIHAANAGETKFGNEQGEDGFKPDVVKNSVDEYGNDTATMSSDTTLSGNAFTSANSSALRASDDSAAKEYATISPYVTNTNTTTSGGKDTGTQTELLSKGDFYGAINSGGSVKFGETEFTSDGLVDSLANGTKVTIGGKEYISGSYSHYLALVKDNSTEEIRRNKKTTAIKNMKQAVLDMEANADFKGMSTVLSSGVYAENLKLYTSAGGTEDAFKVNVASFIDSGLVSNSWFSHLDTVGHYEATINKNTNRGQYYPDETADDATSKILNGYIRSMNREPAIGNMAMYDGELYLLMYDGESRLVWRPTKSNDDDPGGGSGITRSNYLNALRKYKFKTGGLADFTGPAWLDGTPSKPEYVLNSAQTERFFSLVDILEGFDSKERAKPSGDNYFDINIQVEKLENDYDVEQVANKIRSMIYEDASYRNVNAINHIR